MASTLLKNILPFLLVALATSWMVQASDPDIVSDFIVPENSIPDADFFTFTGIRSITPNPPNFNVTKASMAEFLGLNVLRLALLTPPTNSTLKRFKLVTHLLPKGLVHFQYNADSKNPAIAISSFGSANAGTISVPTTVFSTGIDDAVLAKAFKTDVATIQKIKAGLAAKA